ALIDLVGQGREGAEAAQELAKLGTPAAREALVALATDGASATQSHAIEALAKLKGSEVDEALDRLRKTASPTIASRALTQLAKRRGKAALPMLKEAFTEGSVALRRSALRAMSQLNDPKLQELLIKTATSTSDYALRATSVSALARLGTPQAQNALVSMFKTGDRNLRSTAAQTLATMNNAKARDALLNAIKKGEGRVSYALRNAIGQLRDPASRRRLHEMLDDPAVKNAAKTEVIAALALQQDTAGILAVAESHPNIALRQKALVQLGQLGGANAERTLIDATAGDPKTRDAAIRGLAKLASPRAIETLGQALHNPETFKQATAALARDGRKEALSALRESFRGGSKREREIIVAKLGRTPPSPAAKKMLFTA
ncbi:MAG: HEAT repeat domain-containing protein, partial [Deltaproteobacteria bacterium]|nr:HEAT repeat domain-containing protein [Deltaproteobacteria bacterium]